MPSPLTPQWRDSHSGNKYPFEDTATLVNGSGRAIDEDTFVDAAIYPTGGKIGAYISSVLVSSAEITINIGDSVTKNLCSGSFSPIDPPDELRLVDQFGRSAGVLVAEPVRLSVFQAWGAGTHEFTASQTRFVAACYYPVPADMVLGFELDDGNIVQGDVYLVGEDGIALTCGAANEWEECGEDSPSLRVIRVSAIGDPLFRRKKCAPALFDTPRFIRELVFQKGPQNVFVGPGNFGNVMIAQAPILVDDTVLRIRTSQNGVLFEAVGETLDGI